MPEEDEPSYLDDVIEESTVLFASSDAVLTVADPNLHPMGKSIAVFLLFVCMFGFLNGLDYASPEEGLVRPDEFVYRLAQTAPDASATFRGTVLDHTGSPLNNATVYVSWKDTNTSQWRSMENLTDEEGGSNSSVWILDWYVWTSSWNGTGTGTCMPIACCSRHLPSSNPSVSPR